MAMRNFFGGIDNMLIKLGRLWWIGKCVLGWRLWKMISFYLAILTYLCIFNLERNHDGLGTLNSAAAVASERMEAPMKTPCSQSNASYTRGTPLGRLPPNKMASIGTPSGLCHSGSMIGHWLAGEQNLSDTEVLINLIWQSFRNSRVLISRKVLDHYFV